MVEIGRKAIVLAVVILMLGMAEIPALGGQPGDDGGEDRGMAPFSDPPMWTDTLDDMSQVYVPGSGLQGIEVSGGSAHLKAGSDNGWLASEIISAPPMCRYSLVYLEVDTPGASSFEVSILNASADPTEIGYANETISGFKLRTESSLSVYSIGPKNYPDIRIQVNLHADGADRPSLLSWTLYYIGLEEWRDEFRGTGKMSENKNLNFTGDELEVNLSAGASGGIPGVGDYEAYPTLALAAYQNIDLLYPNAGHTGYQDKTSITGTYVWDTDFGDFNLDGYLDLVAVDNSAGTDIYWGSSSGTYSTGSKTSLNTVSGRGGAVGDFNGDGWSDIGVGSTSSTYVFVNDGSGDFNANADITLSTGGYYLQAGDVNGDSFDDLIAGTSNGEVHYGGPTGPSTTYDKAISGYPQLCEDLDLDGYDDVLTLSNYKLKIYKGGSPDIETVAAYTLSPRGSTAYYPAAGDVNGDGYIDIAFTDYIAAGNYDITILEGGSDGWKDTRWHDIDIDYYSRMVIADLDKDGFEDLVTHSFISPSYSIKIYPGKTGFPSTASITKAVSYCYNIAVAIPEGESGGARAYRGTFTTEPIDLPTGKKWDIAYLDGSFPQNTSATITVLDSASGSAIAGYKDVRSQDLDLSGIIGYRTIKLKVSIESEFNTTTPVVDSLSVKWMDTRVWRDEFYGDAKIERMLNVDVANGQLGKGAIGGDSPDLIFPTLLGEANYTTSPLAFSDNGGNDYLTRKPFDFKVKGTSAADTADVNGDGYLDIVFSVQQVAPDVFGTLSPLYLGGPLGMQATPQHRFDTLGASDVVLEDLDDDGYVDVVFAQFQRAVDDYSVNSTLYWGSADGWSDIPDLEFHTKGAMDVEVFDVDNDDDLDLVFACYRDVGTSTDSMVFLQGTEGFCATVADHTLPTKGAKAVAAGDLDGDGNVDLVFANSLGGGFAEIDSYVYWGKLGGGWDNTPLGLATKGATDVKVADLDGDTKLDIVFANYWDNSLDYEVDSAAYINDGGRSFSTSAATMMPTVGATAVAVVDLDGTGWMDLVFACQRDDVSYQIPSYVYLGGASGWADTPDIELPTEGAYDVVPTRIVEYGTGGYLSVPIVLDTVQARDTGTLDTLRYTATMGGSISGKVTIVDANTWEVLGETTLASGTNEWDVSGLFRVKEHLVIRIMMVMDGLDDPGSFDIDDLWINWTKRVRTPPQVNGLGVTEASIYRLFSTDLWIEVADDYDLPGELMLTVQHRINGTGTWDEYLVSTLAYDEETDRWGTTITPKVNADVGMYDFRVDATDLDNQFSNWLEFPNTLEVLNNLPTTPVVHIEPAVPVTTAPLRVEFDLGASDIETTGITYIYRWYKDGVLFENATDDILPFYHTSKGENWTVEVSAFDGIEEGLPGISWAVVVNAPPQMKNALPDPQLDEDTSDSDWLDLSTAFSDADGDPLVWTIGAESDNITIEIDPGTGRVTITPKANWFGDEDVTFVATDPDMQQATQTVTIHVLSVNDIPTIVMVDGKPPASDTLEYTMKQGETLTITYAIADVEGDDIQASVNTTAVTFDEVGQKIIFSADNDAVGTLRFGLRVNDVVSTSTKVSINFVIVIENENDPMETPSITSPLTGEKFKVNQSFGLVAFCDDPDIPYGQELVFVWTSNISGELGTGPSITVKILEPGLHRITVTVSDPDFEKSVFIDLTIEAREVVGPPPDDDPDATADGPSWILWLGIIGVLVVVGAVLFLVVGKRRTEAYEKRMDAEMEEEEKVESMKRAHAAIKELADEWEMDKEEGDEPIETEEYEEIDVGGMSDGQLTMEAKVTEEASDDVQKLFTGAGAAAATVQSEEEKEAMRLENLKRQYQNAIGRLPYGIPSKELADRDWVDLADALATGEKKTVGGGAEATAIDGRWYYSDPKDTGTFLKEHGAKPKEEPKRSMAPSTDKEKLLAKLEERFIMGEISEEAYKELKEKYSD